MSHHQTLICQHVFEGAIPERVGIEESQLVAAACAACAAAVDTASDEELLTLMKPACPHDRIPNQYLCELAKHFPMDGSYHLQDGRYVRQPDEWIN